MSSDPRVAPRVSVVMPLYNKVYEVGRAISSVLAQSCPDFELIVVNDGSTDGSDEVVATFKDPRIRAITQENSGEGAARNRGISEARAALVAFCDADDEWLPSFLGTVLDLKRSFPECRVFGTAYLIRDVAGNDYVSSGSGLADHVSEGVIANYFRTGARTGTPWCTSSVAVDTDAMLAVGGFPVGVDVGADLMVWARLGARYELAFSRSPRAVFYLRSTYPTPPVRMPDDPDLVGEELASLLRIAKGEQLRPLRSYVSMWHRVRATMFAYHGRRSAAARELRLAVRLAPTDRRLYALLFVVLMPSPVRDLLLRAAGKRKARRRRAT